MDTIGTVAHPWNDAQTNCVLRHEFHRLSAWKCVRVCLLQSRSGRGYDKLASLRVCESFLQRTRSKAVTAELCGNLPEMDIKSVSIIMFETMVPSNEDLSKYTSVAAQCRRVAGWLVRLLRVQRQRADMNGVIQRTIVPAFLQLCCHYYPTILRPFTQYCPMIFQ